MWKHEVGGDIIGEINMRLPAKSVGRLRCVSKEWLSITSNGKFISKYCKAKGCFILRNYLNVDILCVNSPPSASSITRLDIGRSLPKFGDRCEVKLLHSCNGLVLCRCSVTPYLLFVINPTTEEHVTVPYPRNPWFSYTYNLAFDPCASPAQFKIYAMTKQYWRKRSKRQQQQHVYRFSSQRGKRTWEKIYTGSHLLPLEASTDSLYWKGKLCWQSYRIGTRKNDFLLLNESEHFSRMPSPVPEKSFSRIKCVTVESRSERLVCVVESDDRRPPKTSNPVYGDPWFEYNIFGMDDVSSGWSLLYCVDLNSLVPALYPNTRGVPELVEFDHKLAYGFYEMAVMSFVTNILDEEDDVLLLHIPTKIVAYNLRSATFSMVWTDQPPYCQDKLYNLYSRYYIWPHANLLCSLRSFDDHAQHGKYDTKATGTSPLQKRQKQVP